MPLPLIYGQKTENTMGKSNPIITTILSTYSNQIRKRNCRYNPSRNAICVFAHQNTSFSLRGKLYSVKRSMMLVNGKVCNAPTQTKLTMWCYICGATSKEFKNLKRWCCECTYFWIIYFARLRIRLFESILHLSYKLIVKKWQLGCVDDKAIVM